MSIKKGTTDYAHIIGGVCLMILDALARGESVDDGGAMYGFTDLVFGSTELGDWNVTLRRVRTPE